MIFGVAFSELNMHKFQAFFKSKYIRIWFFNEWVGEGNRIPLLPLDMEALQLTAATVCAHKLSLNEAVDQETWIIILSFLFPLMREIFHAWRDFFH